MNRITGRVAVSGSDYGVPGIVVTAYDSRPGSLVANGAAESADSLKDSGTRLASGLTGEGGRFIIEYEPRPICGADSQRGPDLALALSGPEGDRGALSGPGPQIVTSVRRNASGSESFLIRVEAAWLREAGVPEPKSEEAQATERREKAEGRTRAKVDAKATTKKAIRETLEAGRQLARKAEASFDTFLSTVSGVSPQRRDDPNSRYVPRGASVQAAAERAIRSGIERRVNRATRVGAVALSAEQAAAFMDADGNFRDRIPATTVDAITRPGGRGTVSLTREPLSQRLCRQGREQYDCLKHVDGDTEQGPTDAGSDDEVLPAEEGTNGEGSSGTGMTPQDVPALIQKLVQHLTPPEAKVVFGAEVKTEGRANLTSLNEAVNGAIFSGGPADAPALYDFHHVQIAFEHVWQELFDEKTEQEVKDLFGKLVEVGVEPNDYLAGTPNGSPVFLKSKIGLLSKGITLALQSSSPESPVEVTRVFDITQKQWNALSAQQQAQLADIATQIGGLYEKRDAALAKLAEARQVVISNAADPSAMAKVYDPMYESVWRPAIINECDQAVKKLLEEGERLIRDADEKLQEPQDFEHFHPLLESLTKSMNEPYRFSVYAANGQERSVNFGLVTTYRQQWVPGSYQAGKLVKTIPLAPKEVRNYSHKTSHKQSRAEKELDKNLHSRRTESAETSRVESEIVHKAMNKTNFQMSAKGSISGTIGVASAEASGSTGFGKDAEAQSQEVKKEFREAVFKAAEEYKSERETTIETSILQETSGEDTGQISNPNDELTVTYLFYELQRRYKVSEQLHRITPVVLVAQEFPNPADIDEAWIIAHDWILRRVILDDSFVPAMNYLASKVVGDEHALQETFTNIQQQRRLTEEIKEELVAVRAQAGQRYAALAASIENRADAIEDPGGGVPFPMPIGFLTTSEDNSADAARVREEAARDASERAARHEKETQAKLEREVTALNALTEPYVKALSDHLNRRAQIFRLRVHLKQNIMYYMQAIWSHEPPDQRFFRLHDVQVARLQGEITYSIETDHDAVPVPPDWKKPYKLTAHCEMNSKFLEYDTLEEVADLDNMLGFKGNYMMFPLKKGNALTDFMMAPYFDAAMGLRDPDALGNWTLEDFARYVCCLYRKSSKAQFDRMLPGLQEVYARLMASPGADGEEIIVPTDSLFIEALPGTHPILEDFKLVHRGVDVKKAQAEVRAAELENVRLIARLLAGEREDPTIEKKVVIEGGGATVVADA